MALFDDRRFLLSHINHSFITGDDTGICEVVMLDEDVFENQHQRCLRLEGQDDTKPETTLDPEAYDLNYESELFESEQGQSYDIASDLDLICHRRRSNTAQRLDRLKKEKINQSRTKTIVWRCNSPTNSHEDRLSQDSPTSIGEENEAIPKQQDTFLLARRTKSPPRKSGLTRLLEKFPSLPKNPFDDFAQFDGGMSESVPVKTIMIFIAISQQQHQQLQMNQSSQQKLSTTNELKSDNNNELINQQADSGVSSAANGKESNNTQANGSVSMTPTKSYPKAINNEPLEVVIVSTAKVQDLIGLICWQYTNEGREPKLNHDINRYCLRIAEDNGEVDPDFTSLNPKEPLSKFNFPSLALTEKIEEKLKATHTDQYADGKLYGTRVPSITQNVITSGHKLSNAGSRLAALTRIIFKDAKLDVNQ